MKKLFNNKGLTLLEIIISIAILSTVIIPLYSMFITSAKFNNISKKELEATQLAREYVEQIKACAHFNDLKSSWTGTFTEKSSGFTATVIEGEYDININVSAVSGYEDNQPVNNYESIVCTTVIDVSNSNYSNNPLKISLDNDPPNGNTLTIGSNTITNITGTAVIRVDLKKQIKFQVSNNVSSDDAIIFYIVDFGGEILDFDIQSGKVIKYSNIKSNSIPSTGNDNMLYKFNVQVLKNSENLTNIQGYKTYY